MIIDEKAYLDHSGIKGMKWGTRKDQKKEQKQQKKIKREDDKWTATLLGKPSFSGQRHDIKIWNMAAASMNSGIQQKINDKYPGDLTKDPKRMAAYHKETAEAMTKELNKVLGKVPGGAISPSGSIKAVIRVDPNTLTPYVSFNKTTVQHGNLEDFRIELKVSKTGHILGFIIPNSTPILAQSDVFDINDFISHYGTKGMRWRNRSGKQKLLMIGAGVAGFEAANYALRRKRISFLTRLGVSLASATAAVAATQAILDREGAKRVSTF